MQGIGVDALVDPRGIPYFWLRFQRARRENAPDSETAIVAAGGIPVTALRFERTDETVHAQLRRSLG